MNFLFLIGQFLFFQVLGELIRPKPKYTPNKGGSLKDISFPTAEPNRAVQMLFGRRLIDNANLFGTWDFRVEERYKRVKTGFFSSSKQPLPPVYYLSAGMVLCLGSGVRIRKVYVGDRLAWEGDATSGATIPLNLEYKEQGAEDYPRGIKGVLEFHSGDSTPSAYIAGKMAAGTTPAWPHLTYVVLRGENGGGAWIGTSQTVEHIKLECERYPTSATTGLGPLVGGGKVGLDANPAYVIAEVLKDRVGGAGLPASLQDASSFHSVASKLLAEGHGTSQLWDNQRTSGDVVAEVCKQIGGALVQDPATGLHRLRLFRANDPIALTLNVDNIKEVQAFSRASMSEATNALALSYTDRNTINYETRPVEVQDTAAVDAAGQVISGTATYAGIMSAQIALNVGLRDLRALSAPLATARVLAIVPKSARLVVGDPVAFSFAPLGIGTLRMRVTRARYAEQGAALCEVEMVEDVFQPGGAMYSTPDPAEDPAAPPVGGPIWGVPPLVVPTPVSLLPPAPPAPNVIDMLAPAALSGDAEGDRVLTAAMPNELASSWLIQHTDSYTPVPEDVWGSSELRDFAAALTISPSLVMADNQGGNFTAAPLDQWHARYLREQLGQVCYAFAGAPSAPVEWMLARVNSVSEDGTTCSGTILTRGLFHTLPVRRTITGLTLLYAADVSPTALSTAYGALRGPGVETAYVQYRGMNAGGLSSISSFTVPGAITEGLVQRPLPPGALRLQAVTGTEPLPTPLAHLGVLGGSVKSPDGITIPWRPAVPTPPGSTHLAITFNPRSRYGGDQPWATGRGQDPDVSHEVVARWITSSGSFVAAVTTTLAPGVAHLHVPINATHWSTSGLENGLSVSVTPRRTVGGVLLTGASQTWYWRRGS